MRLPELPQLGPSFLKPPLGIANVGRFTGDEQLELITTIKRVSEAGRPFAGGSANLCVEVQVLSLHFGFAAHDRIPILRRIMALSSS
jgi:hypothetical protein